MLLKRPKSSTPKMANMKKSKKNKRPKLPTWGNACITVSSSERIPLAIFNNLSTRAMRNTRITRMMVGLIGMADLLLSLSNKIPIIDKMTINMSSWFHLDSFSLVSQLLQSKIKKKRKSNYFSLKYRKNPKAMRRMMASHRNMNVKMKFKMSKISSNICA